MPSTGTDIPGGSPPHPHRAHQAISRRPMDASNRTGRKTFDAVETIEAVETVAAVASTGAARTAPSAAGVPHKSDSPSQ